jgi:protein TonB
MARGTGEGRDTTGVFEHLGPPAPAKARRRHAALVGSLLAHGVVLLAVIGLLQRVLPPVPPEQTSVAMVFAAPPAAAPAIPEQSPFEPPPAPAEMPSEEASRPVAEPAPPVEEAAPSPAPPERKTEAAVPAVPQRVSPAHPPPRRQAAPRPSAPQTVPATASMPAAPAVGAAAPLLPAHPVAGMASDRPPVYPESARRRGQQGRVILQVNVSTDGLPVAVSVAQSSGVASLDAAALSAVQRWRFVPATRAGVPVAATAEVPILFRLVD